MKRVVVMVGVVALLAACAKAPTLQAPEDPDAVVLRVDIAGGFLPVEASLSHIPTWTLYADGRLIVQGPQIEIYPPPALPSIVVRTLTASAVEDIMERAREAGLTGPDKRYDTALVADAPTTTFTATIDGQTHVTEVYALSEADPQAGDGDERAARERLAKFWMDLGDLQSWIDASELGEETQFEPDAMRVYVREFRRSEQPEDLEQTVKDWPLEASLATFGEDGDLARCGVVDGEDFDAVHAAAQQANQLTPWRSDGDRYLLSFRPLLPDESGC